MEFHASSVRRRSHADASAGPGCLVTRVRSRAAGQWREGSQDVVVEGPPAGAVRRVAE